MSTQTSTPSLVAALSTASVLLETSVGALTIDLFGADCPSLTGNFVNLCRCKYWNGCTACEVIPDVAVFFSHAADTAYSAALSEAVCRATRSWPGAVGGGTMWHLLDASAVTSSRRRDAVAGAVAAATLPYAQAQRCITAAQRECVLAKQRISTSIVVRHADGDVAGGAAHARRCVSALLSARRATPQTATHAAHLANAMTTTTTYANAAVRAASTHTNATATASAAPAAATAAATAMAVSSCGDAGSAAPARVRFRATPRDRAAGSSCHAGLLLVDVSDAGDAVCSAASTRTHAHALHDGNNNSGNSGSGNSSRGFRFALTLTARHVDDLDARFVAIGQVREGWHVLTRLRAAVASLTTPLRVRYAATDVVATAAAAAAAVVTHDGDRRTGSVCTDGESGVMASSSSSSSRALQWPRPVRIVRITHATVLPTAGTCDYADVACVAAHDVAATSLTRTTTPAHAHVAASLHGRHAHTTQTAPCRHAALSAALHSAGCFAYWAPAHVVVAANRRLCEALTHATRRGGGGRGGADVTTGKHDGNVDDKGSDDTKGKDVSCSHARASPTTAALLVRLPPTPPPRRRLLPQASTTTTTTTAAQRMRHTDDDDEEALAQAVYDDDAVVSIEYNPHATGPYLSSDSDNNDDDDDDNDRRSASTLPRERGAVQDTARAMHAAKASESLQLMLDVLNEVADVDGSVRPPDNVLFVCKLNPATTSEGLRTCFAQVATVRSCDVVRDKHTGQSLCYAFVELDTAQACYDAVQTMNKALVDDCRIHVDFSQSVSRLWAQRRRELRKRARRP